MNNNDDLLKNYLESQKRQKEILEETKKRRLENKKNKEQTKILLQDTKDEIKTAPEFFILAETDYKNGNFKGAITFSSKAIEIDPKVANFFFIRGLAKVKLIDQQETYDYVKDAFREDPELSKSLKNDIKTFYSFISDQKFDYQSAIDDYNKALEINPKFGSVFFHRGCLKEKLKDYQSAIDDYKKALEINPTFGNAFCHRGWCKMHLNDFDGAINDYTKAIEHPKDEYRAENQFIYVDRAEAKFRLKDYQGAIDDCNKGIEMEPEYGGAFNLRARAKDRLKDYQGAIDDYNKALEIDADVDIYYFGRAIAEANLKDYQGAIDDYNKALEINPNFAQSYCGRGYAKEKLEDYQSAIDDYNKALEIDPNNNRYSFFLADAKRKTRELEKNKEEDQNKALLNIKKVKGKYLGVVNDKLSKKYSEDEIAIACGYFEIKNQVKVPLIKEYREESLKSNEELRQLKSNYSTDDYYLKYIELDIFKGRLCEHDEDHGGILYVPKRIVENSKDWDYQQADLENFDIEYVEYEDGLEDFESNISEKYTEDQIKELDMEKEFLEFYGFSEPMMFAHVSLMHYVDHNLKTNYEEYFEREDIAEAYGIRYQDIHEESFFA